MTILYQNTSILKFHFIGQILKINKLSNGYGQQKEQKMDKTPLYICHHILGFILFRQRATSINLQIAKEQWGVPYFNTSGF